MRRRHTNPPARSEVPPLSEPVPGDPETLRICRLFDPAGRPIESEVLRAMAGLLVAYTRLYGRNGAAARIADLADELRNPTEDDRVIN